MQIIAYLVEVSIFEPHPFKNDWKCLSLFVVFNVTESMELCKFVKKPLLLLIRVLQNHKKSAYY